MKKSVFTIFVALTSILFSCYKIEEYPTIPKIAYESHSIATNQLGYSTVNIVISFIDGEGDIGLNEEDTIAPFTGLYYHNLIVDYYEKVNGEFIINDTINQFSQRIAPIIELGKNKNTKGEIECPIIVFPAFMKHDTIKLGITLIDRALNKSNTVESGEIVF